jgi:hypothetical protein
MLDGESFRLPSFGMNKIILFGFALLTIGTTAQVPVEFFAGHERSTLDIMFFKYFKKHEDQNSRFLFFNRNRASIDYQMTTGSNLPAFGFTEAISYNHERLKGIAPVLVGQVLSQGVLAKGGIQFARIHKTTTVFSWLVCDLKRNPQFDYFILFRFTPVINATLKLFTQFESLNTITTDANAPFNFTQRVRIGLQKKSFQVGFGGDFNQRGRNQMNHFTNAGVFLRYEF